MLTHKSDGAIMPERVETSNCYRWLIESITDYAILMLDPTGRIASWNRGAEQILCYTAGEIIGQHCSCFYTAEDVARGVPEHMLHEALTKGSATDERWHVRKDGTRFWSMCDITLVFDDVGELQGFAKVMRDATKRKQIEEEQQKFIALVENSSDFTGMATLQGKPFYINQAGQKLVGLESQAEIHATTIFDYCAPEAREQLRDICLPALGKNGYWEGESLFRHFKTGAFINVYIKAFIVKDSQSGEPLCIATITHDITERKRMHDALKKSEQRLKALFDNALDAILLVDDEARYVDANPAACELLGYSREELQQLSIWDVTPPSNSNQGIDLWRDFLAAGKMSGEHTLRRKDGTLIGVECNSVANVLPGLHMTINRDTDERKRVEQQLRQAQKMEAVGRLAGGVAHDFNNLLTAITGYSDLMLRRLGEEDSLRSNVEEIRKAASRATALTRQLLAFSRKQMQQLKILNLNSIVSELDKMLQRLIGEDIQLTTTLDPQLGQTKADAGQIEQVIMNLVVNARDAVSMGGKITIETANVYLNNEYVQSHLGARAGRYVMLAVSDTGAGMDDETKSHIFEPFFTTKEAGKGTGLGLATVYGIVKQSNGYISVESEVGQGTAFKVYLPRVDEAAEPLTLSSLAPEKPARRRTETVLLAEDEEVVRNLTRQVLEMNGYKVLEAANGGAALMLCEEHKGPIHLLITDVVMPEMSGRKLAERLSAVRPNMRVLYMSGYTDEAIIRHGVLDEGTEFIQKPFTPESLAHKINELLGASHRESPAPK